MDLKANVGAAQGWGPEARFAGLTQCNTVQRACHSEPKQRKSSPYVHRMTMLTLFIKYFIQQPVCATILNGHRVPAGVWVPGFKISLAAGSTESSDQEILLLSLETRSRMKN